MSEAADLNKNGAPPGGAGGEGSAKVSLPGYVKDNLGKEVFEDWSKRVEKDPEFAKQIPATLPEFAKTWDSGRSQLAEISKKYKEAEEGRKPPNSPQDYAFSKPDLPEGMTYDQQLAESFAQWAHDEKLPVKTAQNLFAKFNGAQIERFKASSVELAKKTAEADATRVRDLDTVRTALRTQWGETYNAKMPRNMAALQNPIMMPTSIATRLDQSGILRDPAFHLWWDRQVSMMSSDRRLGLPREQGDGLEPENKTKPGRLPTGMFDKTAKRYPARKKAG
jgi:hypothetical protein